MSTAGRFIHHLAGAALEWAGAELDHRNRAAAIGLGDDPDTLRLRYVLVETMRDLAGVAYRLGAALQHEGKP